MLPLNKKGHPSDCEIQHTDQLWKFHPCLSKTGKITHPKLQYFVQSGGGAYSSPLSWCIEENNWHRSNSSYLISYFLF